MKKVLAILMAAAMLLMGIGACAESGTMTVQGMGVVTVNADYATISLGVREVSGDVMSAQGLVNDEIASVIEALKSVGAGEGDLSTTGIGIYPNWSYDDNGEESICGYTAYNNVNVPLTDMDKVGAYIDAAFAAGANSLDYVEFSAKDTSEAADQALVLAVESAKQKAQTLADAAGVKLGGIVEITDTANVSYDYGNGDAFAMREAADKGAGTEVLPSRQQVNATVYITFAIEGE